MTSIVRRHGGKECEQDREIYPAPVGRGQSRRAFYNGKLLRVRLRATSKSGMCQTTPMRHGACLVTEGFTHAGNPRQAGGFIIMNY